MGKLLYIVLDRTGTIIEFEDAEVDVMHPSDASLYVRKAGEVVGQFDRTSVAGWFRATAKKKSGGVQ